MKTRLLWMVSALLLVSATASAEDVEWNVDKAHSRIAFTARHLAFAKVSGKFNEFDGTVVADSATGKLKSVKATVKSASVDTENAKRDEHLRSDDFFAAKEHPTLTLETKSIKWSGKKFTAVAALTIRGITKDVKFSGELLGARMVNFGQGAHMRAGYEATATINRKDFGLKFGGLAEGVSIVGDEVQITLEIEISHTPKK